MKYFLEAAVRIARNRIFIGILGHTHLPPPMTCSHGIMDLHQDSNRGPLSLDISSN